MIGGMFLMYLFILILVIAVLVAIARWVLRINDIVENLDEINDHLFTLEEMLKDFTTYSNKGRKTQQRVTKSKL